MPFKNRCNFRPESSVSAKGRTGIDDPVAHGSSPCTVKKPLHHFSRSVTIHDCPCPLYPETPPVRRPWTRRCLIARRRGTPPRSTTLPPRCRQKGAILSPSTRAPCRCPARWVRSAGPMAHGCRSRHRPAVSNAASVTEHKQRSKMSVPQRNGGNADAAFSAHTCAAAPLRRISRPPSRRINSMMKAAHNRETAAMQQRRFYNHAATLRERVQRAAFAAHRRPGCKGITAYCTQGGALTSACRKGTPDSVRASFCPSLFCSSSSPLPSRRIFPLNGRPCRAGFTLRPLQKRLPAAPCLHARGRMSRKLPRRRTTVGVLCKTPVCPRSGASRFR